MCLYTHVVCVYIHTDDITFARNLRLRQVFSFLFQTPFASSTELNLKWFERVLLERGEIEGTTLQSVVIQDFKHRGLSGTSVKQVSFS